MKAILYCEDDRTLRDLLASTLRTNFSSYEVILADDIGSALDKIPHVERLSVVLTDGNLREDDTGWDLTEQLKQRGYTGPIVYLGAAKIPEDKRGLFNDVLIKPVDPDRLVATLEKYL